ncbi:hypothetical protein K7432_003919 [Basidiobolus ranarum]|uniref:Uncharacterized protein n=1 Tax=Basidiobolus ranarum TaxID=34480 RepID=A0ABR2WZ35_9FUNG
MVSLKFIVVFILSWATLLFAANDTIPAGNTTDTNTTIVTPDRMKTIPECNVCMSTLLDSCYQKIATLPTENSPSIDFMIKCICTPGYMENFFNCGICSAKMMGSSKIPTEKDKAGLSLLCALTGISPNQTSSSSASSTPTDVSATA